MTNETDLAVYIRELNSIRDFLVRALPTCTCHWNGRLTSVYYLQTWGEAQWNAAANSCSLRIDKGVLSSDIRWVVFLHEMVHTFSVGIGRPGSDSAARGWEEGVVEALERLLRPELVREFGLQFSDLAREEIRQYDLLNDYNRYVHALEVIGQEVGYDASAFRAFLIDLLSISLLERSCTTMARADAMLQTLSVVERNRKLIKIANACSDLVGW